MLQSGGSSSSSSNRNIVFPDFNSNENVKQVLITKKKISDGCITVVLCISVRDWVAHTTLIAIHVNFMPTTKYEITKEVIVSSTEYAA